MVCRKLLPPELRSCEVKSVKSGLLVVFFLNEVIHPLFKSGEILPVNFLFDLLVSYLIDYDDVNLGSTLNELG